ncbi:MAG: type II toxin-antitoxin system VapC family toxin [Candidatus Gottesmanbacteria bacterium]|nr:type II toxin-antitoxin system VapC family toxin [Candidatus Gottesmanbacteria bacterium]
MINYLVDTSVCVAHIRGDNLAFQFLKQFSPSLSAVTHAELIQGCENNRDLRAVHAILRDLHEFSFTETITKQALSLFEKYRLSHGIQFFDTLIAATAREYELTLVTHNIKHFSFIPGLTVRVWAELASEVVKK